MPTPLRGARILAADLSLSCSGICLLDLDSMMPIEGCAFPEPDKDGSIYSRARRAAIQVVRWIQRDGTASYVASNIDTMFGPIAFEGPSTNARFRNEETTAIRQAFYDQFWALDREWVIVPPTSAKLALTGKGNADKMAMVNAALAQTRGTPFFDTLSALVKPGRKHNPEAEAIADAFGVARAAAKILFQRNARESSVPSR